MALLLTLLAEGFAWELSRTPVAWGAVVVAGMGLAALTAGVAAGLARVVPGAAAVALALAPGLWLQLAPAIRRFLGLVHYRSAAAVLALVAAGTLAVLLTWRPTRRLLALLGALGLVVAGARLLPNLPPTRAGAPEPVGPDIILLVMDTTRRDHLSLYGYERDTSPSLRRLAEKAAVYEDAWSVAPWTPPSHASMFTGLLPAEHGVDGAAQPAFPEEIPSLPELLRNAGYRTAGFPANPNLIAPGWERGFEVYDAPWLEGRHSLVRLLNRIWIGSEVSWHHRSSSAHVLSMARSWWSRNEGAARFLFLNLLDPHRPYDPPADILAAYLTSEAAAAAHAVEQDPVPYHLRPGITAEDRALLVALYDAEVAAMDREMGRFFAWLEEIGDLDGTVVAITADHGERLGERGLVGHDLVMDQFLLQVPLLIRYPAKVLPRRVPGTVQLDGLPGYLLDLAGIPAPAVMAQRSLQQHRRVLARAQYQHQDWVYDRLLEEAPHFDLAPFDGDWGLVTDGRHALAWSSEGDTRAWLVNLVDDPEWTHNRLAADPMTAERLLQVARQLPEYQPVVPQEIDPSARERLRSLGYLAP